MAANQAPGRVKLPGRGRHAAGSSSQPSHRIAQKAAKGRVLLTALIGLDLPLGKERKNNPQTPSNSSKKQHGRDRRSCPRSNFAVLNTASFFLPYPTSPARLLHLTVRRESHTLKSSLDLFLLPWHVPPAAAGNREEEEGKEVTGIDGSKGWQEGEPSACLPLGSSEGSRDGLQGNTGEKITGEGEANLITTDWCTHLFGHEQLGKAQLLLQDLLCVPSPVP